MIDDRGGMWSGQACLKRCCLNRDQESVTFDFVGDICFVEMDWGPRAEQGKGPVAVVKGRDD